MADLVQDGNVSGRSAPAEGQRGWCARNERWVVLALIAAGAAIRLISQAFVGYEGPAGLGGLYLEFSRQIIEHGYQLPSQVPFYTDGGIPYAYPPGPFYVQAILVNGLGVPAFVTVNLLPAALSVMGLPLFYLLVRKLRLSARTRVLAMAAFAVCPSAFVEQIQAAGGPEAMGTLAMILLFLAMLHWRDRGTYGAAILVGLGWAFCILSSPGSAYASVPVSLAFLAAGLLARRGWRRPHVWISAVIVGAVALAASSPYWLAVMLHHGPGVFTATASAEGGGPLKMIGRGMLYLGLIPSACGGRFTAMPTLLVVAGIGWTIVNRRLWPWAALVLVSMVPRENTWLVSVPGLILAAIGLGEVVWPMTVAAGKPLRRMAGAALKGGVAALIVFTSAANLYVAFREDVVWRPTVDREALGAMEWARNNTPDSARFIVIAHRHVLEWSPQIMRRTVLNVPYGAEWKPKLRKTLLELLPKWEELKSFAQIQHISTSVFGHEEVYVLLGQAKLREMFATSEPADVSVQRLWENDEYAIIRIRPAESGPRPVR